VTILAAGDWGFGDLVGLIAAILVVCWLAIYFIQR
jgi:hypothetical protein